MLNHICRIAGDHQFTRVTGDARRADADLRRVAHAIHLHDVIHLILHQARGHIGERHQFFSQQHHPSGKVRIDHRIAERTAAGAPVGAVGIAELIAARHTEKRDVNVQLAIL